MKTVIEIKNLTVDYKTQLGPIRAVRNLSFSIKKGEIFGLVGESGSGKSTAAWVVMRYLADNGRVTEGRVMFHGQNLLGLSKNELRSYRGKRIAMVYQDPMTSLNPAMTVGRQIEEVLETHNSVSKGARWKRVIEMLERVRIPDPLTSAAKFPHELSGGQQQRVVIAMALMCNPDLLILDEPTTGLDVTTEVRILDLIEDLKRNFDSAILFISHNLGVIAMISDRIGVIYAGAMVEDGPGREIFSVPLHPYTEGLLNCIPRIQESRSRNKLIPIKGRFPNLLNLPSGCVFHPRCIYAKEICRTTDTDLIEIKPNRKSACLRWQDFKKDRKPCLSKVSNSESLEWETVEIRSKMPQDGLLELDSVKIYFGGTRIFRRLSRKQPEYVRAVDGVTLKIHAGEVFGLVGESGCGKTTLARGIAKLCRNTSGSIRYDGENIWSLRRQKKKKYHKEVQIVFQNPDSSLNPRKKIRDIIARPLELFRGLQNHELRESIIELLDTVKLSSSFLDRFPHQLSGGEKQRVGIARAFATQPRFIICDEPVSAVDVSVQAAILNIITDLRRRFDVAMLFISHDLSVVRHISHKVAIMYLGEIAEVGEVNQVFSPPHHPYTRALLSAIPSVDPSERREMIRLEGSVPSPKRPPPGCKFHTRCPQKIGRICEEIIPHANEPSLGHVIYCHLYA
jgi:peptide/nickel transport system ATP-binding protein